MNTPMNQIVAINAASGQTIWAFDPKAYADGRPANNGFLGAGLRTGRMASKSELYRAQ